MEAASIRARIVNTLAMEAIVNIEMGFTWEGIQNLILAGFSVQVGIHTKGFGYIAHIVKSDDPSIMGWESGETIDAALIASLREMML